MSRKSNSHLVGKLFHSNNYGDFEIIKYDDFNNVTIQFVESGSIQNATMNAIKNGNVKDRSKPSVYGVGYLGKDSRTRNELGVVLKEYSLWKRMLERCYDKKNVETRKSYVGCEVSDNFKSFEYFSSWCKKQIGFNQDWDLDKDLLGSENKIYSEDVCVFLPKIINLTIATRGATESKTLIGVEKRGRKFHASIHKGKKRQFLGCYETEIEAFSAYKTAKENYLKQLAQEWKSEIDPRAYNALMQYKIQTT